MASPRPPARLPPQIPSSVDLAYDLANPGEVARYYEAVLTGAPSVDDLRALVNGGLLVRVWMLLILQPAVQQAWHRRFVELERADGDGRGARSSASPSRRTRQPRPNGPVRFGPGGVNLMAGMSVWIR
jgi:hypothetical protein